MSRQPSARSRNIEDLMTLKVRTLEPGFEWVQREDDDGWRALRRVPVSAGTRFRIVSPESRRDVRQAVTAFRKLAQACDGDLDDQRLMLAVVELVNRYGTLYGDVPANGAFAVGTLDDWKLELLRFLDLWEIAQALLRPSRERAVASRVELRSDDASGVERFIFRPRTVDGDGELVIASSGDRYTWGDPATEMPIFRRMKTGTPRTRLWVTFTTLVNRQMTGRLSLALHPFETAGATVGITPAGLLALAYTRLWLDVVTAREESTPAPARTCAHCDAPLPETATVRMAYCDSTCRQAHRRRSLRS